MARISDLELERLKRDVSVARLAEAKGVALVRRGDDFVGCCPFHEDKTPSFVVSPKRNLWHCLGACKTGGSVVDFVMKSEGVSFRHAVELLRNDAPLAAAPAGAAKLSTARRLDAPVTSAAGDAELLLGVVDYYHRTLLSSPEALEYLGRRGLNDAALIRTFRLGYSNRTLGLRLPPADRKEGAAVRGRLQHLGVIRESGHEHLNGSLIVPLFDEAGAVVGMYGRKLLGNLRVGTPKHLYLPGPHRAAFNSAALAGQSTVIICEALLDALSFWAAGFRNVTSAYGVDGFTEHHLEALKRHGVKQALLAYDRDDAGDAGAAALAKRLQAEGIECWRVLFPRGMDANDYASKVKPAAKSLAVVLRQAQSMAADGKARPAPVVLPSEAPSSAPLVAVPATRDVPALTAVVPVAQGERKVAAPTSARVATVAPPVAAPAPGAPRAGWLKPAAPVVNAPTISTASTATAAPITQPVAPAPPPAMPINQVAAPAPLPATVQISAALGDRVQLAAAGASSSAPASATPARAEISTTSSSTSPATSATESTDVGATATEDEITVDFGPRRYRVRGLAKPQGTDALRINLLLTHRDAFHIDTLDMYSAKARAAFVAQGAAECGLSVDEVKHDVGRLLLQLETLLEKRRTAAEGPKAPTLSEAERDAALELLRSPELLPRILEDFWRCGVVGEETNKLVGYLAAVSRKLEEPLAVLIQSSSAAGKSSLMEAVLAFVPDEDKVKYSAMTGQSLFYMGDADLKHKVLAVVEEEGAAKASYALKLLQSEGELTIASTGKDPHTGRLVTHEYRVEGPTQLFLTTTATELDDELLNRCLVLSVDEDRAQTSAIHRLQRERRTLEGRLSRRERDDVLKLHRDAQRLLRPLAVVNPYARSLTFPDDKTRLRRDFPKYLTLIDAIALLHQYQRPVKTAQRGPHVVEYVEVQSSDIEAANRLVASVLSKSLDELPPQTRRLFSQLEAWVTKRAEEEGTKKSEVSFTRREVREALGVRNSQLALHLSRLVDFEYLESRRGARGLFAYALAAGGVAAGAPALDGLADAEALGDGRTMPSVSGVGVSFRPPSGLAPGRTSGRDGEAFSSKAPVSGRAGGTDTPSPSRSSYAVATTNAGPSSAVSASAAAEAVR